MKICLAQIRPFKGDVAKNIELHQRMIEKAAQQQANAIFFSELSLSSYEPELAEQLASDLSDPNWQLFQQLADQHQISIGLGMPLKSEKGIHIAMLFFQPQASLQVYYKQLLHEDELPFFVPGNEQLLFQVEGHFIAPAICYESMKMSHADKAIAMGGQIYLASVAKDQKGVDKALLQYPNLARKYDIPVLMVNPIGPCDNFVSAGQSGVWDKNGALIGVLPSDQEGLLIFDTTTNSVS